MKIPRILIVLLLGTASSLSAQLTPTTTTLSSSLNPSIYGQPVTFTAVVTPAPPNGETVTFMQGKNELGTGALSSGSATFTISTLTTGGTDSIQAVYGGDSNFAGSKSNVVSQKVTAATTTTTLVSSQNPSNVGQSVTFTASVAPEFSGTVTGKVGFYNGNTRLANLALSGGVSSYTTTKLGTGDYTITAVYDGDSSYTTSTSSPVDQTVGAGTTIDATMSWDNVTRYYELFVPTALPASPPMLLMLHGTKFNIPPSNPSTLDWGWQPIANEYGFILVQPASTYDPVSGQWNWNAYFMDSAFSAGEAGTCTEPPATGCPDDAGFLRALITSLMGPYNVNPNAIFVTGMSSGGQMTERVGVELSDLVAAIAPTSGQMEGQLAEPPPVDVPGYAVAPISVQEWHGTADENLWPCNYGTTKYSSGTFYLDTVDDTFNYWTGPLANACTVFQTTQTLCLNDEPNNANDAPTPGMPGDTGNIATGCASPNGQNVEVQFIWEKGVAHSWDGANNTARWLFLSSHPKQSAPSR